MDVIANDNFHFSAVGVGGLFLCQEVIKNQDAAEHDIYIRKVSAFEKQTGKIMAHMFNECSSITRMSMNIFKYLSLAWMSKG